MRRSTDRVLIFLLFFFFVVTTAAAQSSKPADINLSKCPQEDIKDARKRYTEEQADIARASGRVTRKGTHLELRSRDRLVVLEDDCTNGESYSRHTFKSFLPDSGYYLIAITGWESSGFFLIRERSGERTNIEGSPVFSPDRQRFISMSMDLETGNNANSIQIWSFAGEGLNQEYNFDTDNEWGPSDPVWKDNGTIAFKKNFYVKPGADYKSVPALLIQKGNTWAIR